MYNGNNLFPSDCAVQMVLDIFIFFYPLNDSLKSPNPVCIACKPKYKATFSTSNAKNLAYRYVVSCDFINNC